VTADAVVTVFLAGCGTTDVTRPRVEAALLPTFTNAYLQKARILGRSAVTRESMAATDDCDKGGPKRPDGGAGADWPCMIHWTDDQGVRQDGKFELQVPSQCPPCATPAALRTGKITRIPVILSQEVMLHGSPDRLTLG
jgi:hypothetical protein